MADHGSITHWIKALESPAPSEAQRRLWDLYFSQLVAVARRKLPGTARPSRDEEDIALSAMNSFFRRAGAGRFPALQDRGDLWPLLVTITARKALNLARDHRARKRGGGRVRGESVYGTGDDADDLRQLQHVVGTEPTPEFAAQVADECNWLLRQLTEELQLVARLRLDGYTTQEIAQKLSCSPRTVERRLELIRQRWENASAGRAVSNGS